MSTKPAESKQQEAPSKTKECRYCSEFKAGLKKICSLKNYCSCVNLESELKKVWPHILWKVGLVLVGVAVIGELPLDSVKDFFFKFDIQRKAILLLGLGLFAVVAGIMYWNSARQKPNIEQALLLSIATVGLIISNENFCLLLALLGIAILEFLPNILACYFRKPTPKETVLQEDKPLEVLKWEEAIDNDRLGYHKHVEKIAEALNKSSFEDAFSVGITGSWGSGKTSYLNLIKSYYRNKPKKVRIVDFEPWKTRGADEILQLFMEEFEATLVGRSDLQRLWRRYQKKLSLKVPLGFMDSALEWTSRSSLSEIQNRLKVHLAQSRVKYFVFIDDIDRLSKEEILEVLRIIRNTSNFPNIVFFVAYDQDYVFQNLKELGQAYQGNYLEKIFQLVVSLPKTLSEPWLLELEKFLTKLLGISKEDLIATTYRKPMPNENHLVAVGNNRWETIVSLFVRTPRDLTRLKNSIAILNRASLNSFDLKDLILLEALRLKYPSVYDQLHFRQAKLFEKWQKQNNNQLALKKDWENELKGFLPEGGKEKDELRRAISYMFPSQSQNNRVSESKSIAFARNFDTYFHGNLQPWRVGPLRRDELFLMEKIDLELEWIKEKLENAIEACPSGKSGPLIDFINDFNLPSDFSFVDENQWKEEKEAYYLNFLNAQISIFYQLDGIDIYSVSSLNIVDQSFEKFHLNEKLISNWVINEKRNELFKKTWELIIQRNIYYFDRLWNPNRFANFRQLIERLDFDLREAIWSEAFDKTLNFKDLTDNTFKICRWSSLARSNDYYPQHILKNGDKPFLISPKLTEKLKEKLINSEEELIIKKFCYIDRYYFFSRTDWPFYGPFRDEKDMRSYFFKNKEKFQNLLQILDFFIDGIAEGKGEWRKINRIPDQLREILKIMNFNFEPRNLTIS